MRLIFMGTPAFALPALRALIESATHEVAAVYSQPPRPAGRGHKLTPSPIQELAELHGVPVYTPVSLRNDTVQAEFRAHGADAAIVAAYGLILPQAILDACPHGCINIHPSDLPRWRGAAPIQRSIMAGDRSTALCIMQMEVGLDSGPVLWREEVAMPLGTTGGALHDMMAERGAACLLTVLEQIGTLVPIPQSEDGLTYAAKITKEDQRIDWARPAADILNQIHGLSPYPAALAQLGDETIKVYAAELSNAAPDALTYHTGDGQRIRITEAQRPGKKRMRADELLRGFNAAL